MNKNVRIISSFLAFLYIFVLNSNVVFAENTIGGFHPFSNMFVGWFENILLAIIALAGIVAAAVLIFNAFLYITASGDEGKVQKATKGITYAIVGLIIAAIAFMIVNFVIGQIEKTGQNPVAFSNKVDFPIRGIV